MWRYTQSSAELRTTKFATIGSDSNADAVVNVGRRGRGAGPRAGGSRRLHVRGVVDLSRWDQYIYE